VSETGLAKPFPASPPAARVAIFGASAGGARAWQVLASRCDVEVVAFLDNDPERQSRSCMGLPVMAPATCDFSRFDVVVLGSVHADEIARQLVVLGVPEGRLRTLEAMTPGEKLPPARVEPVGQVRPRVLNFQVNDICNARCVMCNIWRRKRCAELSPGELAALLSDPYFSELEHVGITGGEPTLRKDLAQFYEVLPTVCPRLTGASFITHGLDTDRGVGAYTRVDAHYRSRNLSFSGMVSIDGVGTLHDRVRGRQGAFDSATRTLFGLKDAGVQTIACCTIVRSNVWGLWELLEWAASKTYVRFRVGEFINRLGNDRMTDEIRAFDDAERAELISFFETLIRTYEPDEAVRRTYASIVSLIGGGERLTTCPYRDGRALNVDCRGEFAICAPKGRPHVFGAQPSLSVEAVASERTEIGARHCPSCIHDYHDEWRPEVAQTIAVRDVVQNRLSRTH
jgi:MoaA/NifB/PqqE/SkfB family radical SAM enzyme